MAETTTDGPHLGLASRAHRLKHSSPWRGAGAGGLARRAGGERRAHREYRRVPRIRRQDGEGADRGHRPVARAGGTAGYQPAGGGLQRVAGGEAGGVEKPAGYLHPEAVFRGRHPAAGGPLARGATPRQRASACGRRAAAADSIDLQYGHGVDGRADFASQEPDGSAVHRAMGYSPATHGRARRGQCAGVQPAGTGAAGAGRSAGAAALSSRSAASAGGHPARHGAAGRGLHAHAAATRAAGQPRRGRHPAGTGRHRAARHAGRRHHFGRCGASGLCLAARHRRRQYQRPARSHPQNPGVLRRQHPGGDARGAGGVAAAPGRARGAGHRAACQAVPPGGLHHHRHAQCARFARAGRAPGGAGHCADAAGLARGADLLAGHSAVAAGRGHRAGVDGRDAQCDDPGRPGDRHRRGGGRCGDRRREHPAPTARQRCGRAPAAAVARRARCLPGSARRGGLRHRSGAAGHRADLVAAGAVGPLVRAAGAGLCAVGAGLACGCAHGHASAGRVAVGRARSPASYSCPGTRRPTWLWRPAPPSAAALAARGTHDRSARWRCGAADGRHGRQLSAAAAGRAIHRAHAAGAGRLHPGFAGRRCARDPGARTLAPSPFGGAAHRPRHALARRLRHAKQFARRESQTRGRFGAGAGRHRARARRFCRSQLSRQQLSHRAHGQHRGQRRGCAAGGARAGQSSAHPRCRGRPSGHRAEPPAHGHRRAVAGAARSAATRHQPGCAGAASLGAAAAASAADHPNRVCWPHRRHGVPRRGSGAGARGAGPLRP